MRTVNKIQEITAIKLFRGFLREGYWSQAQEVIEETADHNRVLADTMQAEYNNAFAEVTNLTYERV